MVSVPPLRPRRFPTSGFVKLDTSEKIKEESLSFYVVERYYPVYIGEMFILISEHLKNCGGHPGKKLVRLVLDSFEVVGAHGKHTCLIYQPLGLSFTEFCDVLPDKTFPKDLVQRSIQLILISLAFMHENSVIEDDEIRRPIARKVPADCTVYVSRPIPVTTGLPVITGFGEARVGNGKYKLGRLILNMHWGSKVDAWSIGAIAWDLNNHQLSDKQHIAEVQLLSIKERQYSGEDKILFLNFLQRIFSWLSDERPTAEEIAHDDFLMQPMLQSRVCP
ncbi:hypothetical protein BDV23DRAFT_176672 [Aspergillus alliaceus]|uniref:Protein kinase domain-containing protein n=1 Tax=Petromyces alliaceus TaxID=209559 RepID=A0A5N7BSV2_PETAA|nr:hypothetical protein BDV23DRAFT_176672 [Aspergillus alliaceus]